MDNRYEIKCLPGCTDCCGHVPFTRAEWEKIDDKRTASFEDGCPYAVNGRCEIYDLRPMICKLFGVVFAPLMDCPRGLKPKKYISHTAAINMLAEGKESDDIFLPTILRSKNNER